MRDTPGPQTDPETEGWWEACGEGRLTLRSCGGCKRSHFPPRSICPFCFSDQTVPLDAAGTGTIYSFSVMRRAAKPYVLAYVTLDEGPRMMTNILTADVDTVRIGQRVKVSFEDTDTGRRLPVFVAA